MVVIAPADFRGLLAGQRTHFTTYTFILILQWLEGDWIRVSTRINFSDNNNIDSVAGKRHGNVGRRFHLAALDSFRKLRHTKTHHLHLNEALSGD